MATNINTTLYKTKQKLKDTLIFFLNLIHLIAQNDILRHTMMMTEQDKQEYLSSEISKFLPLFQKLPPNFKKAIISHHNLSTKIKKILNTKSSNLSNILKVKNKPRKNEKATTNYLTDSKRRRSKRGSSKRGSSKKGRSKRGRSKKGRSKRGRSKRGGSQPPKPKPRQSRTPPSDPQNVKIITQQPISVIPTNTSDVAESFQQLGNIQLANNALLNQQTMVFQEQRRQQTDIDSMTAVVALQTGASNSLSKIFAENIKIIQNELNEMKTDLKEIDTKREEFIKITLQSLNEEWDTEIESATKQWQKYGDVVKSGVKEYEYKDTKAKLCGATCGATSGYLVRDMIISGGTAVKDFLDIPKALGAGATSLGSSFSDFTLGGFSVGKIIGVPISSVGSIFSGTSSTFTEPITNMIAQCGPQCGALIGLSCCICTSAICITLIQEHTGVSDRLKSNDRQQQNWLMRQLSDGTQIASWALVVPLIRDTLGHSTSVGYKKAIRKQKDYDDNQKQYLSYIKKQDMLKGTNPPSLGNRNEWLNQALKINQSLIDIKTKTEFLTQNIQKKNEELQNEMRARSNASMKHVESVSTLTGPDRAEQRQSRNITQGPRQRSLPNTLRQRKSIRSGSAGGGNFKKYKV